MKNIFIILAALLFTGAAANAQIRDLDARVDSLDIQNSSISISNIANGANGFALKSTALTVSVIGDSLLIFHNWAKADTSHYNLSYIHSIKAWNDSLLHYGVLGASVDSTLKSTYGTPFDMTDGQYNGKTVYAKAHENLIFGNVCFMNSDGEYALAKADVMTTMPGCVMALGTINANAYGMFLQDGYICEADWTTVQTKGAVVYVSETTAGLPDTTAPGATGEQVQVIGYCIGTDIMYFSPDWTIVEVP